VTTRLLAIASLLTGSIVVLAGLALIYPPAALVVGGLGLIGLGYEELRTRA
jgi:hypothetical protein